MFSGGIKWEHWPRVSEINTGSTEIKNKTSCERFIYVCSISTMYPLVSLKFK